jgi:IMP dehydrogenase
MLIEDDFACLQCVLLVVHIFVILIRNRERSRSALNRKEVAMPNEKLRLFFEKMDALGLKLTFGDVRLVPQPSDILPSEADVRGRLSRRIALNIPIVSSPMDTVTAADMAIAMAEMGGLGIIHRGLSPEVQAREVGRVKNRLHGRVFTPLSVRENQTVESVLQMCERKKLLFRTFPVLSESGVMLGLITRHDFDFCADTSLLVRDIMTPVEQLLTAAEPTNRRSAYELMKQGKKKVLPLLDTEKKLTGLFVFSDLKRFLSPEKTQHNLDSEGRLVVGAAVGIGDDALARAELLAREGCDVFHIDTAHGDSSRVHATIKALKQAYSAIDVIAGNVSSGLSARHLVDAGTDGILVGQGPGSICTTRVIAGVGVPQVSAVYDCAAAIEGSDVPVCADGGIGNSGDSVIALATGASCVILGRLLAGTDEAPGEVEVIHGKSVKVYRGMGSLGAMHDNASSRERYGQAADPSKSVPEGVEGMVPYRGPLRSVLEQHVGGIRSGMGYHGARTLKDLAERADMFRMSSAGLEESRPHNVELRIPAPNYER